MEMLGVYLSKKAAQRDDYWCSIYFLLYKRKHIKPWKSEMIEFQPKVIFHWMLLRLPKEKLPLWGQQ